MIHIRDWEEKLVHEYIVSLDSALVLSIVKDTDSPKEARAILDTLVADSNNSCIGSTHSASDSDHDSLPSKFESIDLKDGSNEDEHLLFLRKSFPAKPVFDLRFVLRRFDNDVEKAIAELSRRGFGQEYAQSEGESSVRSRDRKRRTQKSPAFPGLHKERRSSSVPPTRQTSVWKATESTIVWLAMKLRLPQSLVASAYHRNPGSISAFILDTLGHRPQSLEDKVLMQSSTFQDSFVNLCEIFPHTSPTLLHQVLLACRDDFLAALEVLETLENSSVLKQESLGDQPIPQIKLVPRNERPSQPPRVQYDNIQPGDAEYLSDHYRDQKQRVMENATQAYAKSKSDKLMSGAAAYYSTLGKEYDLKMRQYGMQAVRESVAAASGTDFLDLHGTTVQQALQITAEQLNLWWASTELRSGKSNSRAISPYRIITGVGSHSKHSVPRLTPSIRKYLQKHKWKFEESPGLFSVYGA